MYQNYIFDLYGTLVDIHTNEQKPYLWQKMACFMGMKGASYEGSELKRSYMELVRQFQGTAAEKEIDIGQVFRQIYLNKGLEVTDQEIADTAAIFRSISMERLQMFEGARELLQALRQAGKKIYLLSNAQALFTAPELRILGLTPCFDGILLSSDVGFKKPSPAFYGLLLERYCLNPHESVMTGNDDEADCWGAAGVGMDSFYIRTEQSPEPNRALPENCCQLQCIRQVFS